MQQYLLAPVQPTWQPPAMHEGSTPGDADFPRADWASAQPIEPVALTAVQRRIYEYISGYQRLWDETPLYREIAHCCGMRSTSGVQHQLMRLVGLGLVGKPPRRVRAISLRATLVSVLDAGDRSGVAPHRRQPATGQG